MKTSSKIRKGLLLLLCAGGITLLWKVEAMTPKGHGTLQVDANPQITREPEVTECPQAARTIAAMTDGPSTTEAAKATQTPAVTATPRPTDNPQIAEYVKVNPDVIGYISIPDTNVDYPVLMGTDNTYYLHHNIYGEEEKAACIMADHNYGDTNIREEFQQQTIIYGHYLAIKTMFTSVGKYKNKEFFEKHPYVYYSNLKQTGKWRVFSVYVVNADKETIPRKFESDEEYINYLKKIKKRSKYDVDVNLTKDSKILTLCTCSYETKNSRAIVHAVLENE